MRVYIYASMYTYTCVYTDTCMCELMTPVCLCARLQFRTPEYLYVYVCAYMCVCTHIYKDTHIFVFVHIHACAQLTAMPMCSPTILYSLVHICRGNIYTHKCIHM